MILLSFIGGFLEIAAFLLAILAFVWAVRFFIDSRKRLNELFPGLINYPKVLSFGFERNDFEPSKRVTQKSGTSVNGFWPLTNRTAADSTNEERNELRRQQKELNRTLQKMTLANGQVAVPTKTAALSAEEQQLQTHPTAEDNDGRRIELQQAYAQKLQEQFLDVQDAFEEIQEKMAGMEQQTWQLAELRLQAEQAKQTNQKLEITLLQKDEKLQALSLENNQLRNAFHELEHKFSEALLQQQQLMRKVHLLEGFNTDMLQMAEAVLNLKSGMAPAAEPANMLQRIKPGEQKNR